MTAADIGGSVKVEGLREAIKQLESLGASKDELVEINLRAADTLMSAAQSEAPRVSGNLAGSMRASKTKAYAQVAIGNNKVPYANAIHWGWFYDKQNFIEKNIKPNKFMYRALDKVLDQIMTRYDNDLQALFNKYGLGAD